MSKINETNYPRRTQANYEDTDMLVIQEAGGNTYTTRIEDLREDCQETLAPALNTMRENLATIEGSTASKTYAAGDYLVFNGVLCKATTTIAPGATLNIGTNIEQAPVGDELSSISSDLASLGSAPVTLWAETDPSSEVSHLLNQPITNFRFIMIQYRTNAQRYWDTVPAAVGITSDKSVFVPLKAGAVTKDEALQYLSSCHVTFTDSTHFTFERAYTNPNLTVRPYVVYGIK